MVRRMGRCPKGERLRGRTPFGRWQTRTFIAGRRLDGLVARFLVPGAMNGEAFDTCVAEVLAPEPSPGDVVILDSLNVRRSPGARAAIDARWAWLLFPPRYSPDPNPIETAFAELEAHLGAGAHRTLDALRQANGSICDLCPPDGCRSRFTTAGYAYE